MVAYEVDGTPFVELDDQVLRNQMQLTELCLVSNCHSLRALHRALDCTLWSSSAQGSTILLGEFVPESNIRTLEEEWETKSSVWW